MPGAIFERYPAVFEKDNPFTYGKFKAKCGGEKEVFKNIIMEPGRLNMCLPKKGAYHKYLGRYNMKRIIALFIIVLMMSVAIGGCGGGKDNDIGPATGGSIDLGDGKKINYGTAQPGKNLSLPDEFPVDILPLMDDARIDFINTNDANQAIGITYQTDKSFDEVIAFYQEVMQDGKVSMQSSQDDSYIIIGSKGSYAVTISITNQNGKQVFVLLDVTPSQN